MQKHWPENRTINIVCHGHSVPAGYFATPLVQTFQAYPHQLHRQIKERFPYAVVNVIVSAIGGENSNSGQPRFVDDVLCHKPDLVTIDYGLNDRMIELSEVRRNYEKMIFEAQFNDVKLLLFTPTWDFKYSNSAYSNKKAALKEIAEEIRQIASENEVGLVDSFAVFERYCETGSLSSLMSWSNHPNAKGHQLVTDEAMKWFSYN